MLNYLSIIRPFNCLFVGLTVLVGALLKQVAVVKGMYVEIPVTVISAVLIAAGGYVINDFYDLSVDRVNKPRRVLPAGGISPDIAYIYALILFAAGIAIIFYTAKTELIAIAIINSLLLYYYAKKLKKTVIIGNLAVSWAAASTFIYGAILTNNLRIVLPIAIYTFLYTLTREIIKDAEDLDGDRVFGVATLATMTSRKGAIVFSLLPVLILTALLAVAYGYGEMSYRLFLPLLIMFVVPLICIYLPVFRDMATKRIRTAAVMTKLHMLLLLITYVWLL